MDMIIGGAYQGKLDYAREKYGFKEDDIFVCTEKSEISFEKPCVTGIEEFVLYCIENNVSAKDVFEKNSEKWQNSVFICREIFSGVVPMDHTMRLWRDETGRVFTYLAGKAESVTRMFCGIPQKLK